MFKNPSFLFDILCTVVWLVLMVRYARKGFLASIVQLSGNLISLLGARQCSAACAGWVFENLLAGGFRTQIAAGLDPEGRDDILSEVKEYHKKTGTTVLLVSHSMEDIAKYANRVLVMSNKKIAMYDTVEKVFARAPELLELGLSVPQVTKIFLKLREMGVDVPADVYTIPYAVKTLLEAKRRRDAGESLVLPRSTARKGGAV